MRRRSLLVLLVLLLAAAPALAGGGPQNVLVVYNPQFPWSQAMALHYQAARHIPADNMLALSITPSDLTVCQPPTSFSLLSPIQPLCDDNTMLMMTVTDFTNSIYNPIVNYLAQKGLTDQVYILVLCEGIPWRMWPNAPENADLKTAPSPYPGFDITELGSEALVDTGLARFVLGNAPPAGAPDYPGYTTYYSTNEAFEPANWTVPTYTATSGPATVNLPMPFLVTMLYGYFAGDYLNGQNLVNDAVDRAVQADATFPTSTFLFLQDDDPEGKGLRSCRSPYFWIEAETMRQKGLSAFVDYVTGADLPGYQPWLNPGFTGSLMGLTMGEEEISEPGISGTTASVWSAAHGWPWANGAYAETLTSFGGYFLGYYQADRGQVNWWHATPEWFTAAGATAGFGTAKEPGVGIDYVDQLLAEFPLPLQFRRYADGFSYVEVMYQSIAEVRDATVVGDPLAAPFAKRPTVAVTGLPAMANQGSILSAAAAASPHPRGLAVQRLEAYLDGHFLASYAPSCPAGNTVSVTLSGLTVSYTTTGGETRAAIFGQLQNAINATFSGSLVAAGTDLGWYENINTSALAHPQSLWGPVGNPTSGQLMLLTQARGLTANGLSTTASLTASAGQNFAHPYWLAPATYGGTQWANPWLDTLSTTTSIYTWATTTTGSDDLDVRVSTNNRTIPPGGETLTVQFQSSDLITTGSAALTLSDSATVANPGAAAGLIAQVMAQTSSGQYVVDATGSGVQAAGNTPASTFTIFHPTAATSPFVVSLTPSPLPKISPDSNGTVVAQTSNGGPGLNYLYLDLGLNQLSYTFTFDTTALALGPHELLIVGIDGGAAEAQGYAYVDFQISPATLSLTTPADGAVTVTPSQASYVAGTPVQVVARPAYGYAFAGWTVTSGSLLNAFSATTTLTVAGDAVLTANFVPATFSATAYTSSAWVYQNTPLTTEDRHVVALTLSVTDTWGNHSYTVTVTQDGLAGVVTPTASWTSGSLVPPTGTNPVVWTASAAGALSGYLVGGRRQDDGLTGTGPCTVTIQIAGDVSPADHAATAQVVLTVRPLGDITGDGAVTTADRVQLLKHFNSLPTPDQTAADFDLDGDGSVTTADLYLLNSILDNLPVP